MKYQSQHLMRDPVRAALMERGTYSGHRGINHPFIPITESERERLLEVITKENEDLVCLTCGSTKTERWLKAMGAISCCEARNMVATTDVLSELSELRPKRRPQKRAKVK